MNLSNNGRKEMQARLFVAIALSAQFAAHAQTSQPSAASERPSSAMEQLLKLPQLPPLTPEQQQAAKAAAEARRVEFERMLATRFVVNGNEVYDKKTELTWQRCNYGQTWDDENRWCKGVAKRLTITLAADELAKDQQGWRIPEISEVMSLLEVACGNTKAKEAPAPVFPEVMPNTYYLSNSIREDQKNVNAAQCFGGTANNVGLGKGYVSVLRLVRSGR